MFGCLLLFVVDVKIVCVVVKDGKVEEVDINLFKLL